VTDWAISSVLVQEEDQVQKPIYFVSKVLQGPEVRYQALEKAALAVPYQLHNKLSPKWTSPFRVKEALGNGAYRLETLEEARFLVHGMLSTSKCISVKQ